jgi:nitroreductase
MTVELPSLTIDELLTTTRCVRRRRDMSRPVDFEVVEECVRIAQQAPTGANRQHWHFVVVSDVQRKRRIADLYREAIGPMLEREAKDLVPAGATDAEIRHAGRLLDSGRFLALNLQDVPVLAIACVEAMSPSETAPGPGHWASVFPAIWSFMLAARSRGLGTCLTTIHLHREQEVAELLGIPYPRVRQAALVPVAHTVGTDFRPGLRRPTSEILHREEW